MEHFRRILLHMCTTDMYALARGRQLQVSVLGDGHIVLAYLVVFRRVGVEVVFPIELGPQRYPAVQSQAGFDSQFDHVLVQRR
jgi:threonine dehydrogenase-like Zn-dependent dehydrogenase